MHGKVSVLNNTPNIQKLLMSCVRNVLFSYRVVTVARDYDGSFSSQV